jgi:hypothetical protein
MNNRFPTLFSFAPGLDMVWVVIGILGCQLVGCAKPTHQEAKTEEIHVVLDQTTKTPAPRTRKKEEASTNTKQSKPATSKKAETVVTGKLGTTKGAQPTVGGRILRREEVKKLLGDNWREQVGKKVRAKGRAYEHKCDPREQCLTEGVIPFLVDLSSLELCEIPGKNVPNAVSCPEKSD